MKEKRRRRRREYLDSYQVDEEGNYSYSGEYWSWASENGPFRDYVRRLLLWGAAALLVPFAAGCFRETGMEGCFYLLIPYAAGIVISVRTLWAAIQIRMEGEKMRGYVYKRTVQTFPRKTAAGIVVSAAALAGILFSALTGTFRGRGAGAAVFCASQAVSLACWLLIRRKTRRTTWKTQ